MTKPQASRDVKTKLSAFEFRVHRQLREGGISKRTILVACSGGVDSMAMAWCMIRLAKRLECRLILGHVHHGFAQSHEQTLARDQAYRVVRDFAEAQKLTLVTARHRGQSLSSEAALRQFRLSALNGIAEKRACTLIAFAHHADDLFETRLIRLIRGTGAQGLKAMALISNSVMRPFLFESRAEVAAYARREGLMWHEDPSNADLRPLRNWIRNDWLDALEKKRPGAKAAMARSLANIVEHISEDEARVAVLIGQAERGHELSIERAQFQALGPLAQRQWIASTFLQAGARDFSTARIEEVRKRLKGEKRKTAQFVLGECSWTLNAERILCLAQNV